MNDLWTEIWTIYDTLNALGAIAPGKLAADDVHVVQSFAASDYRQHPGGRNAQLARFVLRYKDYLSHLCSDADADLNIDTGVDHSTPANAA
jgi:hypothetical protein